MNSEDKPAERIDYLYVLYHELEIYTGDRYIDYETFIGVFSSRKAAEAAIERLIELKHFPARIEEFKIYPRTVNEIPKGWNEGFFNPGEEVGE